MKTILHVFEVMAGADAVWATLATEVGLAGWWSTQVSADVRSGGSVQFTFEEGFNPTMEVTELVEPETMAWRCVGGHEPWADNTFRFEIRELEDDRCQLWFRQDYARELSDEAYGIYNFNWGYYLNSLKLLAETGSGDPYDPPGRDG